MTRHEDIARRHRAPSPPRLQRLVADGPSEAGPFGGGDGVKKCPPPPATITAGFEEAIAMVEAGLDRREMSMAEIMRWCALRARLIARRDEVLLSAARAM